MFAVNKTYAYIWVTYDWTNENWGNPGRKILFEDYYYDYIGTKQYFTHNYTNIQRKVRLLNLHKINIKVRSGFSWRISKVIV